MNRPAFTLVLSISIFLGLGLWTVARSGLGSAEPANVVNERLAIVPQQIGNWVGQDLPVNEKLMKVAGAEAWLSRTYKKSKTGESVSVMVLYGNPADLGAHDPKVCYGGTGFEMLGNRVKNPPNTAGDEFWSARFERSGPGAGSIEVFWAWGLKGDWRAPETSRIAFAGERRIYKMYIQQTLSDAAAKASPLDDFLPLFTGELKTALTR